jgi:hypothetical protein
MSKSTSTSTSTSRARLAATRRVRASSSSSASSSATSPSHDAFLGHWSRDATRNQNVVDYLVAHRVGADALKRARASYEQTWTTSESGAEGEFRVRTTSEEVGIDRTLTYSLGEFVEKYETSAIFGAEPGEVTRVASFDAATRTHTTTTTSSIGHETTTRRVREDGKEMTCERRFVSNDAEVEVDVTWKFSCGERRDASGRECGISLIHIIRVYFAFRFRASTMRSAKSSRTPRVHTSSGDSPSLSLVSNSDPSSPKTCKHFFSPCALA